VNAEKLHETFEELLQRPEATIMSTLERMRLEGEARGEARGEANGRRGALAEVLARQLARRFGPLPDAIAQQIASADALELARWIDRVLDAPDLTAVFAQG
jgi:predicted transposase YdaD